MGKDNHTGKPFVHASLFSGIGGAELAASWMGWRNAWVPQVAYEIFRAIAAAEGAEEPTGEKHEI